MTSAAPVAKDVPAFKTIRVCQPFNVLVSPSSQANQYQIVLDADDSVGRALQASVSNGVLSLGVSGRFSTSKPIKLTVKLPASQLERVEVKPATAVQVVVMGAFSPSSFTAVNSGVSTLQVKGLKSDNVRLQNSGTGDIIVRGQIPSVVIVSSGTGTVYISGVTKDVMVNLSGIGNAVIDAASDAVNIRGQAAGLANVYYNRGNCALDSHFFGSPCNQGPVTIPSTGVEWTCGMRLQGTFNCSYNSGTIIGPGGSSTIISGGPGGAQSSSTSTGGTSSQTFSSGSGSAFAAGSTGGRPFGIFGQTFTSGGGGGLQQSSSSTSTGTQQDLCSGAVSQQDRTMVPTF
ncbi:hypothetical protein COCSUDRAFT_61109 [Coccomyxa subellipsoidea C-169]|uniref:Putative auto-transporter adhesin head GIN domain-containing protein n=1 Tax=Coccomyxa subellipsoidea (strain C-169) TaxID=574566 RepID=I0Z644_COCSC|nr:hypothetical protein COCSUDRAFT_61109 [Coccomyxa subellipsoidea C-169]EIE26113.1 hypothetical protein COCSUDRAFT_61109 [Coccomyxa subellipsoidea C-169]|eukprot:XP_005650657.1 hypothetical protein COCSUDRAFT_61109 [Coccomyxa subellipsoidea C-169]